MTYEEFLKIINPKIDEMKKEGLSEFIIGAIADNGKDGNYWSNASSITLFNFFDGIIKVKKHNFFKFIFRFLIWKIKISFKK